MAVREGKAKVGKGILVTDLALLETVNADQAF